MHLFLHLWCFFLWFWLGVKSSEITTAGGHVGNKIAEKKTLVHVGVVLDLKSPIGFAANACISTAISDFYATHSNYSTRLFLHTRNSVDVVDAAFAGKSINLAVRLIRRIYVYLLCMYVYTRINNNN